MTDGRLSHRWPVRGHGRLVNFEKIKPDAVPSGVAVTNWPEGATAFAEAFANMYETLHANRTLPPNATAATNVEASVSIAGERHDGRNLETEKRLQRYLRDRDTQYQRLVEVILKGDAGAMRCFKNEFGPTAFARHVTGETGSDENEFKRIKTAVQMTRTYLNRVKPVLRGRPPKDWISGEKDGETGDEEIRAFLNNIQRQARGA
jgi:hypothetical protein